MVTASPVAGWIGDSDRSAVLQVSANGAYGLIRDCGIHMRADAES